MPVSHWLYINTAERIVARWWSNRFATSWTFTRRGSLGMMFAGRWPGAGSPRTVTGAGAGDSPNGLSLTCGFGASVVFGFCWLSLPNGSLSGVTGVTGVSELNSKPSPDFSDVLGLEPSRQRRFHFQVLRSAAKRLARSACQFHIAVCGFVSRVVAERHERRIPVAFPV